MATTYFIAGASGYIGSHIARSLVQSGHNVLGLSRTALSDNVLNDIGATPVRGEVADAEILERTARQSDGVIYAVRYGTDELGALEALGRGLDNRPLVFISGASVGAEETAGDRGNFQFSETDDLVAPPKGSAIRLLSEARVRDMGQGMVVRPPLVYGAGGSAQIPLLAKSARDTGTVGYVGPGENCWGYVHVEDLACLVAKVLALGTPGSIYHAVAGEIAFEALAEAVGEALNLPSQSLSLADAELRYGKFAARVMLGSSCRPTAQRTREVLDWSARRLDVLDDIRAGSYREAWAV
jgi:nucleoside-diphosphate-sugar epimerase